MRDGGGESSGDLGQDRNGRVGPARRLADVLADEQEQWFLWIPVFFGLGIGCYFAWPSEPPLWVFAVIAATALVVHLLARRFGLLGLATAACLATSFGAVAVKLRTDWVAAPALQRQVGPVVITGWIELVEPRATTGQRITVLVRGMGDVDPAQQPVRVRVRTRHVDPALSPGQPVSFRATLAGPAPPAAPGDFDFGRMAWYQALGGIGYATAGMTRDTSAPPPPLTLQARAVIETARQAISRRIQAALPGETGAIASALITGERGGISEATNQAYRDSGLFHILSISGLHMVIMAGAVFFLVRLGLAAIPGIALTHPIKKWAAAAAIIAALGYMLLSGSAFATVRSAIMIVIMFMAVILDRPALALRNIALAAMIILIVFPESLLDAGFQMSFAAAIGLVSAYEWLGARAGRAGREPETGGLVRRALHFIREIFLSTIIASIAVAPFGIYHFHNTQQLALIGNAIAIPICNLLVMPAALAAMIAMPLGLEAAPLTAMGFGIDAMTAVARWVATIPGAVVKVASIPPAAFLLMIGGGLWLALWTRRWRLLGLVPFALGVLLAPTAEVPDVLVGRDGATVGARGSDGRLGAITGRNGSFELARWLEADGDRRTPEIVAQSAMFRCDAIGCVASSKGRRVIVSLAPAALRDDCRERAIMVLRYRSAQGCHAPGSVVIDQAALAAQGAHAIYVTDGRLRIATVEAARGQRPWSKRTPASPPRSPPGAAEAQRVQTQRVQTQLSASDAAGRSAAGRGPRDDERPEHEDEDWPRAKPPAE